MAKNNGLLDVAAIAAPLILVVGARMLFSPMGSATGAGGPKGIDAPVMTPVAARKVLPEQQRAAEWIKSIGSTAQLSSPMAYPRAVVVEAPVTPDPEPTPVPTPTPSPRVSPVAGLRLTAILGNSDGGLVAINGKVYRVGDVVRPGVTLHAIDARNNSVTFTLSDGSEVKLARKVEPTGD